MQSVFGKATRGAAFAVALAALFGAIFIGVRVQPPRVRIQWQPGLDLQARSSIEEAHGLFERRRIQGDGASAATRESWDYRLLNGGRPHVEALLREPRLVVIGGVDRERGRLQPTRWSFDRFPERDDVVAQPQSALALAAALGLIGVSFLPARRARVLGGALVITGLTAAAIVVPVRQPIEMGDYQSYTSDREGFDSYIAGSRVRFEAHLSTMLLRGFDAMLGRTTRSPVQAFDILTICASVWFGLMLALAGWVLGWSASALRYLALATAAPATVMFFGYRELGYLSLNPAVFPLLATGLHDRVRRFDAGCAASGLGAALHGFGLLSLVGAATAAIAVPVSFGERARTVIRAIAVGTTAYLIWVFAYIVGFALDVVPGHAENIPWRPLIENVIAEYRVNAALLSPEGVREVLVTGWIVGVPLAVVVCALWRSQPRDAAMALAFALPSLLFLCWFWPVQGLALEADLLFAAFPGFYALAWFASRSRTATWWSLIVLASGHAVMWRVILGDLFHNARVY